MKRTLLALATAGLVAQLTLAPAPATADASSPPPPVLGRWLSEGREAAGPSFVAVMEVAQGASGELVYSRRVVSRDGVAVEGSVETGRARLRDGVLQTREVSAPSNLAGELGDLDGRGAAPRRAAYRLAGATPNVLVGRFEGGAQRAGTETLRRSGADNDLQLLVDGPEAFPVIYRELRAARRQICLQTFSWFDDRAGKELADLLIAKRREGVEVRCLVEAFPQMKWKMGDYLREHGVEVLLHHTLTEGFKNSVSSFGKRLWRGFKNIFKKQPPVREEKRGVFNHDHRKLIVVDGRVAFTGGMNIGDKYLEATTWHDLHCRVEGSAVDPLEAMFYERWHAAGGRGEAAPRLLDPGPGDMPVEVLENLPGLRYDITARYLAEINGARRQILIENPYMLYDPVVDGLTRQARAGVEVTVIVPSNDLNDEAFARDALLWVQNEILRSGVQLYKYRERMAHGKVAVFDQRVATIGTTNLDAMAMVHNAEINLFVPDQRFCRTVTDRVFRVDLPNSDRVQEEKLPWYRKIVAGTMHMIRAFL